MGLPDSWMQIDFLSVRKIPLKEQDRIPPDSLARLEENEEDPEVAVLMTTFRREICKDRDLYDKVS